MRKDDGAAAAAFAQVARRLSLFARALADRTVELRGVAVPRAHWLGREGEGGAIELPLHADSARSLAEWRVRVLREAIPASDGGRRRMASSAFVSSTLASPVLKTSARASPALAASRQPILLQRVFAILDAGRVDAVIATRFPGAREVLRGLRAEVLQCRGPLRWHRPTAALIEGLIQFSLGAQREVLVACDPTNRLHRLLDLARDAMDASCPADPSRQAAVEICALLGASDPRRFTVAQILTDGRIELLAPDAAEALTYDSAESTGTGGDSDSPDLAADGTGRFQPGAAHGTSGAHGAEDASPDDPDAHVDCPEPPPGTSRRQPTPSECTGHQTYDEWDHHAQRYLPDWTCVHEHRLRGGDPQFLHNVRLRHAAVARQIRRRFGALRPEARVRLRRSADGDEIDLDSAIEQRVERRAGRTGDDRVYTAHKADRRDVCVAFLVDMSGSTGFQLPEPAALTKTTMETALDEDQGYFYGGFSSPAPSPPRRRVIDVAKDAIGLMCDGVEVLGDRHAVFGFSGDGRRQVDIHVAKRFDEAWSAHSAAAIGAMQPQRSTRTGAAVRHATSALSRETSGTRLLIVLTDGYPQDGDYGPNPDDVAYGLHDTARAFEEAERAGVTAFCVTVDPGGHDYLGTMCPENRYLVIDDVEALPEQLAKLYSEASWRRGTV